MAAYSAFTEVSARKKYAMVRSRYEAAVVDADAQAHPQQCAPNGRVDHVYRVAATPAVAVLF
ncbi:MULTISPECIES: hypothetical protein [unclassified Mesorhizobium]|uniref:hypothetical protein n=1 Tax=unclassified Mesorhizobium TaxID=325217 RepID=UPI000F7621CA|nr:MULTISPECIES: hypothetical protein [unclassified Mesorhizobium]TGT56863.1 hypothetical protein EN813_041365 [Mesorhizobium sp. M00.F.Ca.ET.170.01.1.1]AZO08631.1 hypothetical protein EJ074_05460 [Mesorhizobium sp. M3A.F.Ca.ET.080.04.2.1]RWB71748.1 MAG: hypothetical protein EOQ49_14670 [Mesorhizobium sp.]RWB85000.1 MAG: hypothetical protein EOQ52_22235 [Mesorhizobium sp.]RWE23433.1 MAG: hypothetical protein EOS77_30430 [Mesorhizobium sp.]